MARKDWNKTQLAVTQLPPLTEFRAADVMEFADLTKSSLQAWYDRGLLKNPAPSGTGNYREFDLLTVAGVAIGRAVFQQSLGMNIEESLKLGRWVAGYCQAGWFRVAGTIDSPTAAPLTALRAFYAESDKLDFVVFTPDSVRRLAPDTALEEVWRLMANPYFTVLDMRAPKLRHFCPIALRLLERLAGEEEDKNFVAEVAELEAMFAK